MLGRDLVFARSTMLAGNARPESDLTVPAPLRPAQGRALSAA